MFRSCVSGYFGRLLIPAVALWLAEGVMNTPAAGQDQDTLRTGRAAMEDWRADRPGVRRRITPADLPPPFATASASNQPRVVPRPTSTLPQVPPGFHAEQLASRLDDPRSIRVAPNGDIFIAETEAGRIRVLRPGENGLVSTRVFARRLNEPFGIAFYPAGPDPQWLYVVETDAVRRFPYRNGDLATRSRAELLVTGLPTGGHTTRDIAFSLDGSQMFVSVGSDSNDGEGMPRRSPAQIARWEERYGSGAAWGREKNRAVVMVFDPNGRNGRIFASGIRNCVGLAVEPTSGDLWCSTNERDALGDDLVPDYITRVPAGSFFGWPWYYIGANEDPFHRGERPDLRDKVSVPDILVQAHSASMHLAFYDRAQFPPEYRGNIFAAERGSWNRRSRTGYKIIRAPLESGKPTGEYVDFMTGFVVDDARVCGRPVGVAVDNDGALLVAEDGNGTLWRVWYDGK
jgi:glucose/arabinose dehydrogenase